MWPGAAVAHHRGPPDLRGLPGLPDLQVPRSPVLPVQQEQPEQQERPEQPERGEHQGPDRRGSRSKMSTRSASDASHPPTSRRSSPPAPLRGSNLPELLRSRSSRSAAAVPEGLDARPQPQRAAAAAAVPHTTEPCSVPVSYPEPSHSSSGPVGSAARPRRTGQPQPSRTRRTRSSEVEVASSVAMPPVRTVASGTSVDRSEPSRQPRPGYKAQVDKVPETPPRQMAPQDRKPTWAAELAVEGTLLPEREEPVEHPNTAAVAAAAAHPVDQSQAEPEVSGAPEHREVSPQAARRPLRFTPKAVLVVRVQMEPRRPAAMVPSPAAAAVEVETRQTAVATAATVRSRSSRTSRMEGTGMRLNRTPLPGTRRKGFATCGPSSHRIPVPSTLEA